MRTCQLCVKWENSNSTNKESFSNRQDHKNSIQSEFTILIKKGKRFIAMSEKGPRNQNGKRNSWMKIVHDMMTLGTTVTLGCDKECPRGIKTRHTMGSFNSDKLSPEIPQQSIFGLRGTERI